MFTAEDICRRLILTTPNSDAGLHW